MGWLRRAWIPTDPTLLKASETRILEGIQTPYDSKLVEISNDNFIHTVVFGDNNSPSSQQRTPLVLIHGFAAGLGFWALNIDILAQQQKVYAIDLLGFGRSSRPTFPEDSMDVEEMYVASLEEWRRGVGLDRMILCGHSFGAYLVHAYTLKHPQPVEHLILADPWGFPEKPSDGELEVNFRIGRVRRAVYSVLSSYNPMSVLRLVGRYGPRLVQRMRPDIKEKYEKVYGEGDTRIMEYIYHCNAQKPSGETAFMNLIDGTLPVFAKRPIITQMHNLDPSIPIRIIVGEDSWMMKFTDYSSVQLEFFDRNIRVQMIMEAGHHIYLDQKDEFNEILCEVCDECEIRRNDESLQAKDVIIGESNPGVLG